MKRNIKVDEELNEIIQHQTKKCEKVLKEPEHPMFKRAQEFLKELEALTHLIEAVKRLPDHPNEAMSQDDEHANHIYVQYVSSKDELNKKINSAKKKKHTILPLDKKGRISTEKLSDMGRYVSIFEEILYASAPEGFIIEAMCEKLERTPETISSGDQLRKMFKEISHEYGYGNIAVFYVSIRKNF